MELNFFLDSQQINFDNLITDICAKESNRNEIETKLKQSRDDEDTSEVRVDHPPFVEEQENCIPEQNANLLKRY